MKGTFIDAGGIKSVQVNDIATDVNGDIYVTGFAWGAFSTSGAYKRTVTGGSDAFVCKMSADLSTLYWFTYFGSAGEDVGNRIVVNAQNEPVIMVSFETTSGMPVSDSSDLNSFTGDNAYSGYYIAKFSSSGGQLLFSGIFPCQFI